MRDSGEALVADARRQAGHEGARSRLRRRHDRPARGAARRRRARRRHRAQPGRGRQPARAGSSASPTAASRKATRATCSELADDSFDLVVSIFGAMFAPKPFDVAKEMVRVTRPGGRIVMGNWIPNDPTLVAQILKISSAYSPPPPEGFVSPMTWGVESQRARALRRRGRAEETGLVRARHLHLRLRRHAGAVRRRVPQLLRADDERLRGRREERPRRRARRPSSKRCSRARTRAAATTRTSIPATFLRVTVAVQ